MIVQFYFCFCVCVCVRVCVCVSVTSISVNLELEKIISGLNCSKSAGYDNIGPKLVKVILPQILQPLVFIYNLSFSTGVFPDALKMAKLYHYTRKMIHSYLVIIVRYHC